MAKGAGVKVRTRGRTVHRPSVLERLRKRGAPLSFLALLAFLQTLAPARLAHARDEDGAPSSAPSSPMSVPAAEPPPIATGPSAPQGGTQLPETGPLGNNRFTFPLELPKARGSVQPNVALVYDSRAAEGFYGRGWNVPLLMIVRTSQTAMNVAPEEPQFRLGDGRKLVALCVVESEKGCPRTASAAAEPEAPFLSWVKGWRYYRPERGDHGERYFLSPLQTTFVVEQADGTVLELGQPLDVPDLSGFQRPVTSDEEPRRWTSKERYRTWFAVFGAGLELSENTGNFPAGYFVVRAYGREALRVNAAGKPQPGNLVRYAYERLPVEGRRRARRGVVLLT